MWNMPHFPHDDPMAAPEEHESDEARTARLLIKTRRRRYLEKHPEYFDFCSLELAGLSNQRFNTHWFRANSLQIHFYTTA